MSLKFIDINDEVKPYLERFVKCLIDRYDINYVSCHYFKDCNGYVLHIKRDNKFYLFIDEKTIDKFIALEKVREVNNNNICNVISNNIVNNVNNIIINSYSFHHHKELTMMKLIHAREIFKISSLTVFNAML